MSSYLSVCVDVGHIGRAYSSLMKSILSKSSRAKTDVRDCNVVLRGWAKAGATRQIAETRVVMSKGNIEADAETYTCLLLGLARASRKPKTSEIKKLLNEISSKNLDVRLLFQSAYLNPDERSLVRNLIKIVKPNYEDTFFDLSNAYSCKLLDPLLEQRFRPYKFAGSVELTNLSSWADHQRSIESKSSVAIKSVIKPRKGKLSLKYPELWEKYREMWRQSISKTLDENLDELKIQFLASDKIHLYPYLCSVQKDLLVELMLDEVENNAAFSSHSASTTTLHCGLGSKVMIRYLKSKHIEDGSHNEIQRVYNSYLADFCTNPDLMGRMNSREYFRKKAFLTKNYAIYKDQYNIKEEWPNEIVCAVGRFLYRVILREIKFDPATCKNPQAPINELNLVPAFYTAYFQVGLSHKIKEEFRAHQEFDGLQRKASVGTLRFDYSFLPTTCPPMPWLSRSFGGYLTNQSSLVRLALPAREQVLQRASALGEAGEPNGAEGPAGGGPEELRKLYPSLDSITALGLCPWVVNKDILNIVIKLFRNGGDTELSVPLDDNKMRETEPQLKEPASKVDKILYTREKKKFDQKKREMFSLWSDCLYRLSIANHFRNKVFWFPHNMDFRGRTYPIPPHFNHLGGDLARALLLFARGEPLGAGGLDWLKIHLINLVGSMKSSSLRERLEHANSILELEVLDSADRPWEGRRWWTRNENPWQVLACCKEIARAVRSPQPEQYVSHFPVHQDGSCNGLQHYAALGRDLQGAEAVNLVPNERPQDVYMRVVELVEQMRAKDALCDQSVAAKLDGLVQRKVIKQTVMTTVYGVTRYGARHQIARQLAAKGCPERLVWQGASYLVGKTFESIGQMFNKSRLIQDWLTSCAHIIAANYRSPVSWETPLGFLVVQPYTLRTNLLTKSLVTSFTRAAGEAWGPAGAVVAGCGSESAPAAASSSLKLNRVKQKNAFPPNYIHSLDSSHMMLTSIFCQRAGISFVSVHDCYWSHASSVDLMNSICREQFLALHSQPLLEDLSRQFLARYGALESAGAAEDAEEPAGASALAKHRAAQRETRSRALATFGAVPPKGKLELRLVLDSTYFFS